MFHSIFFMLCGIVILGWAVGTIWSLIYTILFNRARSEPTSTTNNTLHIHYNEQPIDDQRKSVTIEGQAAPPPR